MSPAGLLPSFLAAIQASLSVLLVIFYGAVSARLELLDSSSSKTISRICVKMFLPALLLTKIGSQLNVASASQYGVALIWALACHFISFIIGLVAHRCFGMPDWSIAALMFNNTLSYPLLLIQSLQDTGILQTISGQHHSATDAVEKAKSYFLVFATVSSCLTFAVGPRLMDAEHAYEVEDESSEADEETYDGYHERTQDSDVQNEETGLLRPRSDSRFQYAESGSFAFSSTQQNLLLDPADSKPMPSARRPSELIITKKRWLELHPRLQWWLLFFYDFFNMPLIGAFLGAVIGLIPPIQSAFFSSSSEGGIFTAWLTASLKNIGAIFVPLPLVVAGVSLYTSYSDAAASSSASRSKLSWPVTTFILSIRFVVWPAISISVIFLLAKRTSLLGEDPMLWFALMLMPTGPPAMKLITMVQVSNCGDEEEHKIAKLLTVSYILSPVLAFTVVGALKAAQAAH